MFLGFSPAFHQLRPPATRPQVVAVLTLAATCPTFVGSPYRLKLQAAKDTSLSEQFADFADQFKTASVAGAVAFFMNCGIQGVNADPSTLSNAYATSPGGVAAPMEQRISHAPAHAPLNYQGVQQQLVMKDFDAQSGYVHQVSAPADVRVREADANALQAANDQTAGDAAKVEASAVKQVETEEEVQLEALEGRIKEEKLRLSEAAEQLKTLEEDLQAAKVKRAMQEAAGMDLSTEAGEGWGGFRDLLLLGFGAVLGAVGHGLAKLKEEWSPKMPMTMPSPSMQPSTVATSGALGLAFAASVHSTAPALTLPTPVYPAALPLLTMRKAVSVPESEVSSPSSSPMWGERPFVLQ
ncbi:unnamed protein product [Cladocopium goreaui]|uniref:Uncharacterized protein n=1 Tax=Cladocopium goreaui TaxID=2562237 RepID=A0A9P1C838_9DINO|nr:unnamed protein product [Cladocopium goreaui]